LAIQIRKGKCEKVRQLLISGEGSVSDIITPFGISPLELSFLYNQTDVSKLLIQAGAKLGSFQSWPLSEVFDFMRRFSMSDCSMSAFDFMADNARQMAGSWHFAEMETSAKDSAVFQYSASRLMKSIQRLSSEHPLLILADCGYEINEPDYFGRTPLHLAVLFKQVALVAELLLQGADPNAQDFNGATPLHIAAGMGLQECANALLESNSIITTIPDRCGCFPLHWASNQGQAQIIRDFIDKGMDLDIRSELGEPILFYATHTKSFGTVRMLVELGASPTATDSWGYTPVLDACFSQATDELALFLDAKFNYDQPLHDAQSLLHIAARAANLETLDVLLQADLSALDPDAVDNNHMTATDYLRQRPDYALLVGTFDSLLRKIRYSRLQQDDIPQCIGSDIQEAGVEDVFYDSIEFLQCDWQD
jgi:ankyrin repeat protein